MHWLVVRKFSICRDFPKRQGRNIWKGICCTHCLVVRRFSICKDFPERQGMDTWRGMLYALCCKEIFLLYGFSR